MSQIHRGVGVNGEPDDFAARYDQLVRGATIGWVLKTVAALATLLVVVGVVSKLIFG